jgi:hypothetical protein
MTRPAREAEVEFTLRIDFTGICLYLWGEERKHVTVVMPDAAIRSGKLPRPHPDGTPAAPHAGYVRFDLRNLATQVTYDEPRHSVDNPSYEVVHRFRDEELVLSVRPGDGRHGEPGLPSDGQVGGEIGLPDLPEFAPVRKPLAGLEADPPPRGVLMRTKIVGGSFRTPREVLQWKIDGDLRPDQKMTRPDLGGDVIWERTLRGAGIDVTLTRFDGKGTVKIPLVPVPPRRAATPEIRLKVANLCSNPLEWPELDIPRDAVPDVDFKWLYRLLEPRANVSADEFPTYLCPVPEPVRRPDERQGDRQDCFGLQVTRR